MKRGRAGSTTAPIGWVFLDRHRHDGYTVRWRRGDAVAHILIGQQVGNHGVTEVLDTISVLPSGWTDLAEIRLLGQRWLRQQRENGSPAATGTYNSPGAVSQQ